MAKPTQQSLDEAVHLAQDEYGVIDTNLALRAHALTLDELYGRKPPISDARALWTELMLSRGDYVAYSRALADALTDGDEASIALIETKFAELRGERGE